MFLHYLKRTAKSLLAAFVILAIGFTVAKAQGYGKIRGKVTDSKTGEPLIGANVKIKGTSKGATASEDGTYNILQVEPGTYTLVASYIGYHKKTIKNVRVQSDLSTTVNIELVPTTVESPELVVTAETGNVQKDVTSSRVQKSRVQMERTAGVETTADFFKMTGAVVKGRPNANRLKIGGEQLRVRDESITNIHVRGGRGGELLFLIDGMPVTDPIYGGRSVIELNVSDVESMELITGAFKAEYGRAQSGVVKINTRSGADEFRGTIEYKNDTFEALGHPFDRHFLNANISGPLPTGPLPGKLSYFISGSINMSNAQFTLNREREVYKLGPLSVVGKEDNKASFNAKLNYEITPKKRISFFYNGSWQDQQGYNYSWKNYPDHMTVGENVTNRFTTQWHHTLSSNTFYRVGLQYLGVSREDFLDVSRIQAPFEEKYNIAHPERMRPSDFWVNVGTDSMRSIIQSPTNNPATGFISEGSWQSFWRDNYNETFSINGDLTSQVHPSHMMKTGFQLDYMDLNYLEISGGGTSLSPYGRQELKGQSFGEPIPPPPGPFKYYGSRRFIFNTNPLQGSIYIQDKFELSDLIINYGIRDDWFWVGNKVMDPQWQRVWHRATGLPTDWNAIKNSISPRFGISFPISEETVMFFSYGHFSQLPELHYYYRDPYSGSLTGNPHLDFVRTIKYEFGFTHQLTDVWTLDIKSYNRNVAGQLGSLGLEAFKGLPVAIFQNSQFARVRGIEAKIKKDYSNHYSGNLTYTLQWATGFASSAFQSYVRSRTQFPKPIREHPLFPQDVRHQVLLSLNIFSPKQDPLTIFGWETPPKWNLNILSDFRGSRPYTPGTVDPVERQLKLNSKRGPWALTTDIKFRKRFNMAGLETTFMVEVFNAFGIQNPTRVSFNNWQGRPYKFGDLAQPTKKIISWKNMFSRLNPHQFTAGRRVQIGFQVSW